MQSSNMPRIISSRSSRVRRWSVSLAGAILAITLSGCVTTGFEKGPTLPTAPLPDYHVGMSYTFDDGQTETVMAQDGEVLTWRTGTGVIRTRYRNFLIPYLSWQNSTHRSQSQTDAKSNMLWPLQIGDRENFSLRQVVEKNDGTDRKEYSQTWQCKIDGTETVSVPAGTFDTYRIPCYRYYRQYWRQTETYYYAPTVGHYVMLKDDSRTLPSQRRRLVSYGFNSAILPAADRTTRQNAIQRALEYSKDGVGVPWKSSDGKVAGLITPIRSVTVKGESRCRIYNRSVTAFGHIKIEAGKACRKKNKVWWEVN